MEITGEHRILASRDKVWKALNDPDVLRASIPGLENLDKKSDTEFAAVVVAKVGPVKARFKGSVTLSDLDPPRGYRIMGEGQGGAAGFAKGTCLVSLHEEGMETLLRYQAEAQVGGKIAQIGSRMISGVATRLANDFFSAFAKQLEPSTVAGTPSAKQSKPAESTDMNANINRPSVAPTYWIAGLIIIAGLLLWLYS
ncbi:uncharacterized protein METZ01_LOCUS100916 [marine metagenome]|uniref:Carbon monoxide dehydrogenase subunit G n=1 Tax=marine metagenome TaxID=408172 RepID=A0A381W6F9_9ZZZZ